MESVDENVIPLLKGNPHALESADKNELLQLYEHYRSMSNELLRRAIIEYDRLDLLATQVLDYDITPMHLNMLRFQFQNPRSLQLAFRGAGKTTICTVAKVIHYLLKNPNLRICLASKSLNNAQGFLKEIKGHFENNQRLEEIFGPYFDPRKVTKWDSSEIEVLPRTLHTKEASITCAGVEGTIVSKHYDVIISDDLVDEDNARTKHMRDKTRTWYYQTLDPCLMPPDQDVMHRGDHHVLGTRYHYDDLYGRLSENEFEKSHQIIPALNEDDLSPWPEKYPPEWFKEKRENAGTIIFNAQYLCNTEAMKGEVFQYDDCQLVSDDEIPNQLRIYQGVDLAITEKEKNDQYADVVIGIDRSGNIYVMDAFLGHIAFGKQLKQAREFYKQWDPIRAGAESNAYQDAFRQAILDIDPDLRFVPIHTDKDKMTRAWKLQPMFEKKKVFFRKHLQKLIEQFVLFPSHRFKDGMDAFDLAVRASKKKRKRAVRNYEPGVI